MFDGSKPLEHANHEDFAQAVVRLNNQAQAWRGIYDPEGKMQSRTSWVEACKLANRLDVSYRIDWLRAQTLERSQISVATLMRDLYDIATADRTEITRHIVGACRHCHGLAFKYQWVDTAEFAEACEAIEKHNAAFAGKPALQKPLPSFDGGEGFDAHRSPHVMCPECLGVGIRTVWVADTSTLSDKARKLLTGQVDKAGLPILVDPMQARDQLHKLAGAYKVNDAGQSLAPPVPAAGEAAKPGDASVTYLSMVRKTG